MLNFPVSSQPVLQIDNFAEYTVEANQNERQCRSTPGHLLHWVTEGEYELFISGKHYSVKKGDFIYYHNSESVFWLKNKGKVTFYSLSFQASNCEPLDKDSRVFKPTHKAKKYFTELIECLHKERMPFHEEIALAQLLKLIPTIFNHEKKSAPVNAWTRCENKLLKTNQYRSTLAEMSKIAGVSRATLARACHQSSGCSPLKRLQSLRMEKAMNFVRHSTMRIGEIAMHLGYDRMHEFSREFKMVFAKSPRAERDELFIANK